jgi:hypothetical protein
MCKCNKNVYKDMVYVNVNKIFPKCLTLKRCHTSEREEPENIISSTETTLQTVGQGTGS